MVPVATQHIDRERQAFYLDGPNDVDWIFRNEIERRREEAMYVDYVAIRDHFHDEHQWQSPNLGLLRAFLPTFAPSVLRVAQGLHHAGFTSPDAVGIVAEIWRSATPDTKAWPQIREVNIETLRQLEQQRLLRGTATAHKTVANQWRPPLYALDLRRLDIRPAVLRDTQEQWRPYEFY